ncbi:MAG: hypothetical protein NTV49_13095 [Kiritimatiellaeota bacterium]|nr:hypothetical protein [Kiritimatiellota bacterium]
MTPIHLKALTLNLWFDPDSPKGHGEWEFVGPAYSWTISPSNSSYLTFIPTNAATVVLSLLNSNAWGRVYTITNIATWSESNIVTHAVRPVPPPDGAKTNTMLLDVLKVEFTLLWETKNKANQIFNPARKDDPVDDNQAPDANDNTYGVPRNYLYMVPEPDGGGTYKVTIALRKL